MPDVQGKDRVARVEAINSASEAVSAAIADEGQSAAYTKFADEGSKSLPPDSRLPRQCLYVCTHPARSNCRLAASAC